MVSARISTSSSNPSISAPGGEKQYGGCHGGYDQNSFSLMPRAAPAALGISHGHRRGVPGLVTRRTRHAPEPGSSAAGAARGPRGRRFDPPPLSITCPTPATTLCAGAPLSLSLSLSPLSRLSLSPEPHPQRHQHRAQHVTRTLGFHALGDREHCLGAFPGAQRRSE
jgi:hypothetical protein